MSLDVRLAQHLTATGLFDVPGLALLAVSGGSDSVALLDLMATLAPNLGLTLAVGHLEHGIQPATRDVPERVAKLAMRYDLPCHIAHVGLGPGASETVARRERYRALRSIQSREKARYLVTAHHRDDQVETVLYRFCRGSGVAGLAGIPSRGPRGLVRPLLPFARVELARWLETRYAQGVRPPVFEDPANVDGSYDRVWIRHTVLPLLRDRLGSRLDDWVLAVADDAARERCAWGEVLRSLPDLRFRVTEGSVEVARAALQRYHKMLSLVLLRAAAREVGCRLGRQRAEDVLAFAREATSGRIVQLGGGWEAEVVFQDLRIKRVGPLPDRDTPHSVTEWGVGDSGSLRWNGWEFNWRLDRAKSLERASLTTWVTEGVGEVRCARAGDRMLPLGGIGRRKVRRLLMEGRIPARERRRYPVLVRAGEIVWIPGICRAASAVPEIGDQAVRIDATAARPD